MRDADSGVTVEFLLLGPVQVRVRDRLVELGARPQRLVLAGLALEANTPVPVSRLIDLAWPQRPPGTARGMVHGYVSGLRSLFADLGAAGRDVSIGRAESAYVLHVDPARIDVHRFLAAVDTARRADDERAVRTLDQALGLWRGPPLTGLVTDGVRERMLGGLLEARLAALEDRADALIRLGRLTPLIGELRTLVEQHPYRPRLIAALMVALHVVGRSAEAVQAYRRTRQRLASDLGREPPADLRRLQLAILRGDGLPAGTTVPLVRPAAPVPPPAQLPADLPAVTGRSAELAALLAAADPTGPAGPAAVGTLDGVAGVGKTALAVHAAHLLADRYPDGQLFVDLHGSSAAGPVDPADAVDQLLRSVGVPAARLPVGLAAKSGLLRGLLAGKRMLLLLDDAAGEAQVRPLLPGPSRCLTVVTSRRPLVGLDGAHRVPLDVPGLDDAVALLAAAGLPAASDGDQRRLRAVAGRCGRLPLALRIAAARHRDGWTVGEPAGRRPVPGAPGRRDAAAAIDLSYRALGRDHQRALRLLGLNPTPDLAAAAGAALVDLPEPDARRLLADLADAQLLRPSGPDRHRLPEPVHRYAAGLAEEVDTAATRRQARTRLLDHYRATAAAAVAVLHPHERDRQPLVPAAPAGRRVRFTAAQAAAWLDAERAALRAATALAASQGWPVHAVQLAAILRPHLDSGGHGQDALTIHAYALQAAQDIGDRASQAAILRSLGGAYWRRGRHAQAVRHLQQALELARDGGDRTGAARALGNLGLVLSHLGRYPEAAEHYRRCLEVFRELRDGPGEALALDRLGEVCLRLGRVQEAQEQLCLALVAERAAGDQAAEATSLARLGEVYLAQGRYPDAQDSLSRAVTLARTTGHRAAEADALACLGAVCHAQRSYRRALDHLRQARALAAGAGYQEGEALALVGLGHTLRAVGRLEESAAAQHAALSLATASGSRYLLALAHDGITGTFDSVVHADPDVPAPAPATN